MNLCPRTMDWSYWKLLVELSRILSRSKYPSRTASSPWIKVLKPSPLPHDEIPLAHSLTLNQSEIPRAQALPNNVVVHISLALGLNGSLD